MTKRVFSILLAALFAVSAVLLPSCSESKTNADEETAPPAAEPVTAPDAEIPEEPEEEAEILPDIPELDFGGEDFTFLTSGPNDDNGSDWITYDVWVEELNGEVINDAVFERNTYLQDTYKFKFIEEKTNSTVHDTLKKDVKSGGSYDAAFTGIMRGQSLGADGFTHRMSDVPYIDLTKPWWDHRATEDLTMLGAVYQGTGDISVIDNDATWILMFNKQMREDLQLEDIYDLVREDRWTYDTFYEMLKTASRDADGNGNMDWKVDTYGLVTTGNTCYGLLYASGEKMAPKNEEGIPTLITSLDRMTAVVEKAGMILGDLDNVFVCDRTGTTPEDLRHVFEEGRGLFYGEVMQCVTRMRDSETDFGVIPWPKFDEGQSKFYNFVHNTAAKSLVIPVSQNRLEMAGAIVEAMAAKSMYTLTKAYYDVAFTYKYMRDEESAEMLDIILDSRSYDPAYINDFGGFAGNIYNVIYNGGANFASKWSSQSKVFTKTRDKMFNKLADLNAERGG